MIGGKSKLTEEPEIKQTEGIGRNGTTYKELQATKIERKYKYKFH